jgi:hypothetical protein
MKPTLYEWCNQQMINKSKPMTAVEWLDNELWKLRLKLRGGEISLDFYCEQEVKLIEQAKAMEKEQIMDFTMQMHKIDCSKTGTDILLNEAELYYNETYNK